MGGGGVGVGISIILGRFFRGVVEVEEEGRHSYRLAVAVVCSVEFIAVVFGVGCFW